MDSRPSLGARLCLSMLRTVIDVAAIPNITVRIYLVFGRDDLALIWIKYNT